MTPYAEQRILDGLLQLFRDKREEMEQDEQFKGYTTFDIIASFNAHNGDMKVVVKCYNGGGSGEESITSPACFILSDAVRIVSQRRREDRGYAPLCLPRVGDARREDPDEIPF